MYIFIITMFTILLVFLLNPLFKKVNSKVDKKMAPKLHVHHSALGVFLLAIGVIVSNVYVIAIGLGIYLAHGIEEIYFNKTNPLKAFFVFVSR
jgi:hypothetical protein